MKTINKCGHPERRHEARGMCKSCYEMWKLANSPGYREARNARARKRRPNDKRADKCAHTERRAHAYGMCCACYNRWAKTNSPRYLEAAKAIYRRASFKKHYGITLEHYESLLKAQDGLCAICRTHTTKKRLAVDHDHATGKVRGLLCHRCNVGIGQFKESAELLDKAKAYLARLDANCPTDPAAPTNSGARD